MICNKCKEPRPIGDFHWKQKSLGIRHGICCSCKKVMQADWYQKNKNRHRRNVNDLRRIRRADNRRLIVEYLLSHACVDCGERDILVLQFDHVRGEKKYNVGEIVCNGYLWTVILKEIEKCEVRCSNCHDRRTAKVLGSFRLNLGAYVKGRRLLS